MCAINGFTFPNRTLIQQMNQLLMHRGPDDTGSHVDLDVSLGSNRLSIIDVSRNGHMPMSTTDKRYWIVYNGEIYNFKALRNILKKKGYKFKSQTDSEVVLIGFQHYGPAIVPKLNGMFAFAIWDKREKTLFLARDRIGIKPLYYCQQGRNLIFSSEIKAILKHRISRKIDQAALNLYFRLLYVPGPLTMFRGIYKLLPGHALTWHNGHTTIKRYWQPSKILHRHRSPDQLVDLLEYRLTQSVRQNLVADRPVGIFLSGGLDSSLILALASKIKHSPINTYTVGFKVDQEYAKYNQDLFNARLTSHHFKSNHREITISAQDLINNIDKLVYHLDEPVANITQIGPYLLSKLASESSTVVLSGDGGDELFLGYDRYRSLYWLNLYRHFPQNFRNFFSSHPLFPKHLSDLAFKANLPSANIQLLLSSQAEPIISQLVSGDLNDKSALDDFFQPFFSSAPKAFNLDQFPLCDLQTWLPDESLVKSDKLSMAHSLEQRVPILDNKILELSLQTPFLDKFSLFSSKKIMRLLAKKHLPNHIAAAPKWGFFSPMSKWIRTDLKSYMRQNLSNNELGPVRDFLDPKFARKLFNRHLQGEYHPMTLWSIVTFSLWYRKFVSR